MNHFKGTKGKWVRIGDIVYMDDNSKTIYPYYECKGFGIERDYNALLISKAPEMLEMLERIKKELPSDQSWSISLENEIEELIKSCTEL